MGEKKKLSSHQQSPINVLFPICNTAECLKRFWRYTKLFWKSPLFSDDKWEPKIATWLFQFSQVPEVQNWKKKIIGRVDFILPISHIRIFSLFLWMEIIDLMLAPKFINYQCNRLLFQCIVSSVSYGKCQQNFKWVRQRTSDSFAALLFVSEWLLQR